MLKRKLFLPVVLFFLLIVSPTKMGAQTSSLPEQPKANESYVKAKVIDIIKEQTSESDGYKVFSQTVKVQLLEGPLKGQTVLVDRGSDFRLSDSQKVHVSQIVILDIASVPGQPPQYAITDTYRLNYLIYILLAFFIVIIVIAGKKGIGSIVGLGVSLLVILGFIVPQMLQGHDPLLISIAGSFIILIVTTYLAHGFSKQTTIAVVSTFVSLSVTVGLALLAVNLAHLAGLGTEDSYLLELNPTQSINPKGLLLGGIIIGTLGALNDITTTQVASIFALKKSNPSMHWLVLAEHGFLIGREHIVSLVNTLVLAYAGSALTVFIFFILNPAHIPWWVIINNESVAEEIVRTLAGSFGLVLAVPFTTALATAYVTKVTHEKS